MIFSRLQKINLTVKLSKCKFIKASVTLLCHTVGHGCVAPLQAKTLSINQYPAPTSRREVCRFLGMAGYYRRFCANFATVAAPITSLLKKELKFQGEMNERSISPSQADALLVSHDGSTRLSNAFQAGCGCQ